VSEFDAAGRSDGEEVHGIAVDQADLLEIDRQGSAFLIDRGAKDLRVVGGNPSADPQDREAAIGHQSVDSAGHSVCAFLSKPTAIRNLLKTKEKEDPLQRKD